MAMERFGGPMVVPKGVGARKCLADNNFKHLEPISDIHALDARDVPPQEALPDLFELVRGVADVEAADDGEGFGGFEMVLFEAPGDRASGFLGRGEELDLGTCTSAQQLFQKGAMRA